MRLREPRGGVKWNHDLQPISRRKWDPHLQPHLRGKWDQNPKISPLKKGKIWNKENTFSDTFQGFQKHAFSNKFPSRTLTRQDFAGDDPLKIFSGKVVVQPAKPFFVNPRFRVQKHKLQSGNLSRRESGSSFEVGETSKTSAYKGFTKHLLNVQHGQENNLKKS